MVSKKIEQVCQKMNSPIPATWFNPKLLVSKRVLATCPQEEIIKCLRLFARRRFGEELPREEQSKMRQELLTEGTAQGLYKVTGDNRIVIMAEEGQPTVLLMGPEFMHLVLGKPNEIDYHTLYGPYEEHFRQNYIPMKAPSPAWYGSWIMLSKKVKAMMDKDKDFEKSVWDSLERYGQKDWGETPEEDLPLLDRWVKELGKSEGRYHIQGQEIVIATDNCLYPTVIILPEER